MDWDLMLADLESSFDAERRADLVAQSAELAEAEHASIEVVDRLRGSVGRLIHHRPRADDRSFAYPYSAHNNRAPSDPNIILNHNRIDFRVALIFQSLTIKLVIIRIKQTLRPHHDIIAYRQAVAYFAINADARVITDYRIRHDVRALFNIDVCTDMRRHSFC